MAVSTYSEFSPKDLSFKIVFEDDDLLVLNKPPGLVVNESETVKGATIQAWMKQKLGGEKGLEKIIADTNSWQKLIPPDFNDEFGSPEEIFLRREGIVHRLDKETSGVLLLAKNPGCLVNLLQQFKQRRTKKKYLCLVHGKLKVSSGTIRAPVARSSRDRHKFRVEIDGRSAKTHYRLKKFYSKLDFVKLPENQKKALKDNIDSYQQGFSLVECLPETGRTHQIRVHFTHIRHPLVADAAYGGQRRAKLDRVWCPRQFLHALQIQITHPRSQKKTAYSADLSDDLNQALTFLSKS